MIRTERLLLRPLAQSDVDAYVAYRSDPATLTHMDSRVPPDPDRVRDRVDRFAALGGPAEDVWFQFAITLPEDGAMVGDVGVGIKPGGGVAEIGYVLRPEFRGLGYASEAAGALVDHLIEQHSIHRIEAVLSVLNPASMRVLESIGMQFESITRLSCCVDGVWEDDLHYAMLADDRRAWVGRDRSRVGAVELVEIDDGNVRGFGALATHHSQRRFVAPMAMTFQDALFPETVDGVMCVPWMRGLMADGVPAGFMMCSTTNGLQGGWYLWRLLIDRMHQRRGVGAMAIAALFEHLRALGVPVLYTSCGEGPGGPRRFYERLGFRATGEIVDDETELMITLS
jgi:RimJ/RimL family protein N-acetyltransferase